MRKPPSAGLGPVTAHPTHSSVGLRSTTSVLDTPLRATPITYLENYYNDVSCEFDEFRVDTHLCKLCTTSIALFDKFMSQNLI